MRLNFFSLLFSHCCEQPFRIVSGSGDSETSDSESESEPDVEVTQLVKPVPLRPAQIGIEEINRMLMEARKAAEVRTVVWINGTKAKHYTDVGLFM